MDDTYTYALVRAIPDARRGEWINIGVAVFLPDRLDIRLLTDLKKLQALAPTFPISEVKNLPQAWNELVQGMVTEDRHALLSRLPTLRVSSLAWFLASPATYENQLRSIMRDLVLPPVPAARHRRREVRLIDEIRYELRRVGRWSKRREDISRGMVVEKYPLVARQGLYADFARRNGALYIAEAVDLRMHPHHAVLNAGYKALTIERSRRALEEDQDVKALIAVMTPTGSDIDYGEQLELLRNTRAQVYQVADTRQREDFFADLCAGSAAALSLS